MRSLMALLLLLPAAQLAAARAVAASGGAPAAPPDTIYYGGRILTGVGLEQGRYAFVSAMAVRDGVLTAVGVDPAVLRQKGPRTALVDLRGAFVMPGFNDAHTHLAAAGQLRLRVDLTGCRSLPEMLDRIHAAALTSPPGHWLTGGGWDETLWQVPELPTAQELDQAAAGHPAIFERVDGHIAVADTLAFQAAGITPHTPDPPGGHFDTVLSGIPHANWRRRDLTGIVREEPAMRLILDHVPPPSPAERTRALTLALAEASRNGVTSVQDLSAWEDFLALEELEREDHLPVRVYEWLPFSDPVATLEARRARHPSDDRMLRTGMLKGFLDGSLGSSTAALIEPYADDPANRGLPRYGAAELDAMTRERAAFQIGFHAIGDRAVGMALDAFEDAAKGCAPRRPATAAPACLPRPRIEHSQVVVPADFDRYRRLGVVASMQPSHLLTDMAWAETRLGPARARYSYAWRSFLSHGVRLAFGTDYPVESVSPFRGLYAAVTRMNEAGTRSYFPEERLTLAEALYAYTQGSAYAEFSESYKGTLAPGRVADFIVLDRDLTRIPAREILDTRVLRTVVAGHPTWIADVTTRTAR